MSSYGLIWVDIGCFDVDPDSARAYLLILAHTRSYGLI